MENPDGLAKTGRVLTPSRIPDDRATALRATSLPSGMRRFGNVGDVRRQ
jgi:hypothetical protein